jgi:YD repeat-containing protein
VKFLTAFLSNAGVLRAALAAAFALATPLAGAQQQYGAYHFTYPYDGNNRPIDFSRAAIGSTVAEACSKRSQDEITGGYNNQTHPLISVGVVQPSPAACGYLWLNTTGDPDIVIVHPVVAPQFHSCESFAFFPPAYPKPPLCPLNCPADQKDPETGLCRLSTPKNAGRPCPECGNPVNPGTGNKFQAERDLVSTGGQLGFMRYYNSGVPAYDNALGGFWLHSYSSRILVGAPATQASVYRSDGRQLVFTLDGPNWIGPADVADRLTELKNAQGIRTGWHYFVAATDDTEHYDASGKLTAIVSRSGLTQTLTYTDGTDGAVSGNGGFALDIAGNPISVILDRGLLLRVRDHMGRTLTFGYTNLWRLKKVTDPAGGTFLYVYTLAANGLANLTSVTYPDGRQRVYHYNEPANTSATSKPNALTGITDENGVRFATYKYDTFGRAIETVHHANGTDVNRYQLAYNTSGAQTTVTDPLGMARAYGFQVTLGVVKNTALSQPQAGSLGAALSYDANGNVSSRTDFNGNRTNYTYDLVPNLETSRTEGLTAASGTTPQTRTISTQWDTNFRLPAVIAEPLRITTNVYDSNGTQCGARGALCSRSVQATTDATGAQGFSATASGAARTWTYTYNANGSVLTVNGPRTDVADVTTYTYYANNDADLGKRGNVATITNAAGHTTSITAYNAHGQPLTMVDANGLTTTMTYDPRQRLTSRTMGSEATTYDYDFLGQLTKVTLPDGSFLSYDYDTAHRLTGMQDNLGNRIVYTLDGMGNRTNEEARDPANQLAQTRSRVFNNLNRLFRELGAQGQTTEYGYDDQGNVVSVKDSLNRVTTNQYDALNRLRQVTSPAPISAVTQYAYDGIDQLVSVSDPRSLVTGYAVDGLGKLNVQSSPDTGTTTNTYDDAGNLLTQTDAKSQVTTYAYDALNRVTLITFHDGSKQAYVYDQPPNGVGRLSSITESNPANQITSVIAYAYDQHGRVTSEARTVGGVQHVFSYRYDSSGRFDQLTYPSGRLVSYSFDGAGRVSAISTTKAGDQPQSVVSGVTYHPFGGVKGYTLGNGQTYVRGIDLDGRIASYTLGAQSFAIGYDAASRISFISDVGVPANTNTYGYDELDRLISAVLRATPYAYTYDAVGNRLTKGGDVYSYSSTSNRVASITPSSGPVRSFLFDPNGSTTADGQNTYAYDVRGRMVQATSSLGATSYQVNALGQRIRKTNTLGDTVFHYDTQGKLIAETGPGGALKRELIYLGDIPVGVIQ